MGHSESKEKGTKRERVRQLVAGTPAGNAGNGFGTKRDVKYNVRVLDTQTENVRDIYTLGKLLGEGSYGVCRVGTNKITGEKVAVKTISKGRLLSASDVNDIRNEVLIMQRVAGHPNVVTIKGAYEDVDNIHIVLELCTGGDLFDRIISKGKYSEKDCATMCRAMLTMLDHLHKNNVMHRDLKPENFLLDSLNDGAKIKATDFGLSCVFQAGAVLTDPCGTPMYIAPEVIRGRYTQSADVWSAGVVLYIMLSGKVPFYGKTDEDILRMTLRGRYSMEREPWPHISDAAKECVRLMLTTDPNKRPSAKMMLEHPWIQPDGVASDEPLVRSVLNNLNEFNQWNKFKRKAVQVMASNMSQAELESVRKAFNDVDLDQSGNIKMDEMKAAIEKLGGTVAEQELLRIWDTYDLDGNGTIEYEEFLAATANLNQLKSAENFRYAFRKFDLDGDGRITAEEVLEALRDSGVEPKQAADIVVDADLNKDGVIDFDEFATLMMRKERMADMGQVRHRDLRPITSRVMQNQPVG